VQAGMSPEQIQDIVMGTIAAALDTGDIVAGSPQMPPPEMPVGAEMAPQGVPMMPGQEGMV
jgi:hypothetical protein